MKSIVIKTYKNQSEAEMAKSILLENGIGAFIEKTTPSGISNLFAVLPAMLGGNKESYNLLVSKDKWHEALEVIK